MRRLALLVLLAPLAVAAQPSPQIAQAEARLATGDSSRAYQDLSAAVRRGADDPDLLRLRLRLELDGIGVGSLPRFARHQQIVDSANRLRKRVPSDTLALRVLAEDEVWTTMQWHNRVLLGLVKIPSQGQALSDAFDQSDVVSDAEIDGRLVGSRFDTAARQKLAPDLDASGEARTRHRRALEHLDAWLAADPAAPRAYFLALTLAVLTEEWPGALAVAQRFQAASSDPRADLYAGLALFRLDRPDEALAAFDRALGRMTGLERTRFQAIRLLLLPDRQAAYDADPEAVTRAFWVESDSRLLTDTQERRAEHFARVVEADILFGRDAEDLFALSPPRGAETDQGRIWVRYGRPSRTITFSTSDHSVQMYGENQDVRFAAWEYPGFRFVFDDPTRAGTFRTYSPPASAYAKSLRAQNDDYVMQDRQMQRGNPQQTQDQAETVLDVPTLISRFRAPGGGTEVVVAFGVPAREPAPIRTGVFALWNGAVGDRVVEDRPRLAEGRVTRAGGEPVWADAATVRLPVAGRVRVEVETRDGTARGAVTEEIAPLASAVPGRVPGAASGSSGLGVSDLLLATSVDDDGQGVVVRNGVGIVPAPRAAFPTTDPIYVYLEAYGLGLDGGRARYTVEATLRPQAKRSGLLGRVFGRGQGPGVSVRSEAEGSRSDDAISFFIDVRDQDPGAYTLRVEVADAVTGQTASAERGVVLE